MTSLMAGASAQGQFEERLKKVIKEIKDDPNIVLFIDEIHLLLVQVERQARWMLQTFLSLRWQEVTSKLSEQQH